MQDKFKIAGALSYEYFTTKGPREMNQDNFYIDGIFRELTESELQGTGKFSLDGPHTLSVFDGMGGETSGECASLLAAQLMHTVSKNLEDCTLSSKLQTYYENFIKSAKEQCPTKEDEICGTTCAGLYINGMEATPYWLGDSRAYLLRDGRLILLTHDHSVAQGKIDAGLMTEEEARKSRVWHMLMFYMGDPTAEIEIGESFCLKAGDRLFITTDGITDACVDSQLEELLALPKIEEVRTGLTAIIEGKQQEDNCSYILMEVQPLEGIDAEPQIVTELRFDANMDEETSEIKKVEQRKTPLKQKNEDQDGVFNLVSTIINLDILGKGKVYSHE